VHRYRKSQILIKKKILQNNILNHLQNSTHPTTSTLPFSMKTSSEPGKHFLSNTISYQDNKCVLECVLSHTELKMSILLLGSCVRISGGLQFLERHNGIITSVVLVGGALRVTWGTFKMMPVLAPPYMVTQHPGLQLRVTFPLRRSLKKGPAVKG
jgi:hypothetical protein